MYTHSHTISRHLSRLNAEQCSAGFSSTIRQFAPNGKVELNRSPHPNRETGQKDDREAHDEEHGAGGGVGEFALETDDLAHPAARAGHAVEEEEDATDHAGQPEDQPGQ